MSARSAAVHERSFQAPAGAFNFRVSPGARDAAGLLACGALREGGVGALVGVGGVDGVGVAGRTSVACRRDVPAVVAGPDEEKPTSRTAACSSSEALTASQSERRVGRDSMARIL